MEQTFEDEIGFDYSYDADFDYGIADTIEIRTISTGASGGSNVERTVSTARTLATGSSGGSATSFVPLLTLSTGASGGSVTARVGSGTRTLVTGSSGGSHTDAGLADWAIDGRMVTSSFDLEVTASAVSISFDVDADDVDHWRQYDRVGDFEVVDAFGGRFEAIDRSGEGSVQITAPLSDTPPMGTVAGFVDEYDEEQLSVDRYRIEIEVQRSENRAELYDTVDEAGEWTMGTERGSIGLDESRVSMIDRDGSESGAEIALELQLEDVQAAALLDAVAFPGGVVERPVPDGPDFRSDTTDGRQTIDVDAPSVATLDGGEYLVTDWTLTRFAFDGPRWLVEIDLTAAD